MLLPGTGVRDVAPLAGGHPLAAGVARSCGTWCVPGYLALLGLGLGLSGLGLGLGLSNPNPNPNLQHELGREVAISALEVSEDAPHGEARVEGAERAATEQAQALQHAYRVAHAQVGVPRG